MTATEMLKFLDSATRISIFLSTVAFRYYKRSTVGMTHQTISRFFYKQANYHNASTQLGLLTIGLVCQNVWGPSKKSGQCFTHSVTTAGMLAEPIRLLHTLVLCQNKSSSIHSFLYMTMFQTAISLMLLVH